MSWPYSVVPPSRTSSVPLAYFMRILARGPTTVFRPMRIVTFLPSETRANVGARDGSLSGTIVPEIPRQSVAPCLETNSPRKFRPRSGDADHAGTIGAVDKWAAKYASACLPACAAACESVRPRLSSRSDFGVAEDARAPISNSRDSRYPRPCPGRPIRPPGRRKPHRLPSHCSTNDARRRRSPATARRSAVRRPGGCCEPRHGLPAPTRLRTPTGC